jgi:hypothetical protein
MIVFNNIGGTTRETINMTTTKASAEAGGGSDITIVRSSPQIVGLKNTASQHRNFDHTGSLFKSLIFNVRIVSE